MALQDAYQKLVPKRARTRLLHLRQSPQGLRSWLRGRTDIRIFLSSDPRLVDELIPRAREAAKALRGAYDLYINSVSSPSMAGSLQTISLLSALCDCLLPTSILDLGSGFSTYAFSRYAERYEETQILSIDDSPEWLGRTKAFIEDAGLPCPTFAGPEALTSLKPGAFDLIFHDLGFPATRGVYLASIFRSAAPNGIVILDDIHVQKYLDEVVAATQSARQSLLSLRSLTIDRYWRYAGGVVITR